MEEKERYEETDIVTKSIIIYDHKNKELKFLSIRNVCDLLNRQDKRIKELEQENQELKIRLDKTINDCNNLFVENQQLKQQLHDLPKKIIDEIKVELNNIIEVGDYFDTETDEETNLLKQSDIENILDKI